MIKWQTNITSFGKLPELNKLKYMEYLIREYGSKRVDMVKEFCKNEIETEICLDAWKEYSINPHFFDNKEAYFHEFDKYENVVKTLGNYFDCE